MSHSNNIFGRKKKRTLYFNNRHTISSYSTVAQYNRSRPKSTSCQQRSYFTTRHHDGETNKNFWTHYHSDIQFNCSGVVWGRTVVGSIHIGQVCKVWNCTTIIIWKKKSERAIFPKKNFNFTKK